MNLLALIAPYAQLVVAPLGLSLAATSPLSRKQVYLEGLLANASFAFEEGWMAGLFALSCLLSTCENAQ